MRKKNTEWYSSDNSWNNAHAQILQDIRDELQKLNSVFECPNFLAIPNQLRKIAHNTTKRRRKVK